MHVKAPPRPAKHMLTNHSITLPPTHTTTLRWASATEAPGLHSVHTTSPAQQQQQSTQAPMLLSSVGNSLPYRSVKLLPCNSCIPLLAAYCWGLPPAPDAASRLLLLAKLCCSMLATAPHAAACCTLLRVAANPPQQDHSCCSATAVLHAVGQHCQQPAVLINPAGRDPRACCPDCSLSPWSA
jgi:hypothetical protein